MTAEGYLSRAFVIGCSAALTDQQVYAMTDGQQLTIRMMEFLLKTDAIDLMIAPKDAIRPALGTGSETSDLSCRWRCRCPCCLRRC